MPVFNEGGTLDAIVTRVLAAKLPGGWRIELTVVDDGSRPDAAAAVRACARRHAGRGHVHLVEHPRNRGKGAALMTGFDRVLAVAAEADAALVQDADLEYDPADYAALLAALRGPRSAVFGNRWANGDVQRRGAYRRIHALGNTALTVASNAMTGLRLHDMECCYKLLPVPVLREIRPWMTEERFGIEPQIAAALGRLRVPVAEVPVRYDPRGFAEGKKIRAKDGLRAFWVIARERLRSRPGATP
jgi:glycosyltransferase involved in cell wall biosynthesis